MAVNGPTILFFLWLGVFVLKARGLLNHFQLVESLKVLVWNDANLICNHQKCTQSKRAVFKEASYHNNIYVKFSNSNIALGRNVVMSKNEMDVTSCVLNSYPNNCLILLEMSTSFYATIKQPRSFFAMRNGQIYLLFTFRSQSTLAENLWSKFKRDGKYDLNGGFMAALHKDFAKFATSSGCKDEFNGLDCSIHGIPKPYFDQFKSVANLSIKIDVFNGDWGSTPINGNWSDYTAFSDTAVGKIMDNSIDFFTIYYTPTFERRLFSSFSHPFTAIREKLFYNNAFQNGLPDWTKFLRPFSLKLWLVYGAINALLFLAFICFHYFGLRASCELVRLTFWFLFVVVFAFHNGALTMFFTTMPEPPARDLREAMRSFPKWKLMIAYDNAIAFQPLAVAGDPDYAKFWARVESNRQSYAPTYAQAVDKLIHEPGWIFYGIDHLVKEAMEEKRNEIKELESQIVSFGGHMDRLNAFILPINSAFSQVINYCILKLSEDGIAQVVIQRSRSDFFVVRNDAPKGLSFNDVILLFALFMLFITLSIVILALEHTWVRK